jgi:hypothetical protein
MYCVLVSDCTAMIPPCTMLDHTVNQIRLLCARGFRDANHQENSESGVNSENHLEVF